MHSLLAAIDVLPTAFKIGPLEVTGFGLAVLLAFMISGFIAERETERRGYDPTQIGDLLFAAVVGTLVGAKLYYVIVLTHDWRDIFSRGGFVFWGGFMGAVAACFIVARIKRMSFVRASDVAGIAIAAGYAVGRTGCWAVGDDYGRAWSGPLAARFPQGAPPSTAENMAQLFGSPVPAGVDPAAVLAVHPTQLYETAMALVMFAVLWRLRDHEHAEGWLFGVYCALAGVERFVVEFYRAKDDRFLGPFTSAQMVAFGFLVVGAVLMIRRRDVGPRAPGVYAAA